MATLPLACRNVEEDLRYGYCRCGCGQKTSIPKYGEVSKGWQGGVPLLHCNGHFVRKRQRYEVDPVTGCWNWLIGLAPNGYPCGIVEGKFRSAIHRVLYEILKGPVPKHMDMDHLCRNRR